MHRARRVVRNGLGLLAITLVVGCPAPADPATQAQAKPDPKPAPAKPDPTPPTIDPSVPVLPSLEGAPAVPSVTVLTTVDECPALATPATPSDLVAPIQLLHAISCRPELFGQAKPAIVAAVSPAEGLEFTVGRRYATVELVAPVSVKDVLAAAGIEGGQLRLEHRGWSTSWRVVDASGKPPSPWPPGELTIWIGGDRHEERAEATLIPIDDEVVDSLTIAIPEAVLSFEPDAFAAATLVTALHALADNPALLVDPVLPSLGERYTTSYFSRDSGDAERVGVAIRPLRTELIAADLAKALGVPEPSHQAIRITDTNPNRLASAGATPFEWRGLSLEIELAARDDGKTHLGLADWVVTDVLVLPR